MGAVVYRKYTIYYSVSAIVGIKREPLCANIFLLVVAAITSKHRVMAQFALQTGGKKRGNEAFMP